MPGPSEHRFHGAPQGLQASYLPLRVIKYTFIHSDVKLGKIRMWGRSSAQ